MGHRDVEIAEKDFVVCLVPDRPPLKKSWISVICCGIEIIVATYIQYIRPRSALKER